jgi:hypothetical protein
MNNNLEDLYTKVAWEIYPEINELKRGVLYKTIQIILLENDPNSEKDYTARICNNLGINPRASKSEDVEFTYGIKAIFTFGIDIDKKDILREFSKGVYKINEAKDKLLNVESEEKKMDELMWIVIVACTLVGALFCLQYLNTQKNKKKVLREERPNRKPESIYTPPSPPIPVSLCLIVPSNVVSNLSNSSSISSDNLARLIDSASYFICTDKNDANSKEKQLTMTDEVISPDSNREVYVRISISDGRNLINKKITYMLKTNLPVNSNFIVEKIACLRSLTGLENFNRV